MKKHIPTAMTKFRHDLPWLTTDIKQQIRRKDRCYRKARKTKTKSDWSTYQHMRHNIQELMKTAHDTYIYDVVIGATLCEQGNQKKFWSFVKLNKTKNIGIPILSDADGLHITDNAKAEALINRQFVSVFTNDDGNSLPDKAPPPPPSPDMDDINCTQPGIEKILDNIKPNKLSSWPRRVTSPCPEGSL